MSQYFTSVGGGGGGGPILTLTSNVGGAVPPTAGNINTVGDAVLITGTGNPGTSTITYSVVDGNAGQLIIGGGGAGAQWADLTSTNGTIVITPGVNTLDIDVVNTIADQYDTDAGSAVPALGILNILGTNGITTSGAGNTVTIDGSGTGLSWTEVTLATGMAVNNGYIANSGAILVFTLPAVAAVGDIIEVSGKGAGGWIILQNAGQTIYYGATPTTTGGAGSLSSTQQRDAVRLLCVTANNDFNVLSSQGNLNAA